MQRDAYRGSRYGLPQRGPGSVASLGRRLAAIAVDWFAALVIALVLLRTLDTQDSRIASATLAIFAVQIIVLTWSQGASFGQRLLGLVVAPVGSQRLRLWSVAVRTLLICVVIPAIVIDRDGRGIHDQLARTIVITRR